MNQQKSIATLTNNVSIVVKITVVLVMIINSQETAAVSTRENHTSKHQISARSIPLWVGNLNDTDSDKNVSSKLSEILRRIGPNMRAASDYSDFNDIYLNESVQAWKMMHNQIKKFALHQVDQYAPQVESLLEQAQVSDRCSRSVRWVLESMRQLDSRAIQMWSSTGNFPPVGMLGGHYTDLGSYTGCLEIKMNSQNRQNDKTKLYLNQTIPQYTSYCSIAFRPIVPSRPRFHMITEKEPQDLIDLFNQSDAFWQIAQRAQFYHYIYLKTGICVPSDCNAFDLQQVSNLVANRLYMMAGPVKCFTYAPYNSSLESNLNPKETLPIDHVTEGNKPVLIHIGHPMNDKQLVAAILLSIVFFIPLIATLWHVIDSWPEWCNNVFLHKDSLVVVDYNDYRHEIANDLYNKQKLDPDSGTCFERKHNKVKYCAIEYLSVITNWRQFIHTSMRSNEIKCLHGLRVITMIWIILVHAMQYIDWSAYTGIFYVIGYLQSPILHPVYNANYVVDNFFLMSGLLVSYTTWFSQKGSSKDFSPGLSFLGRYLRLTPQVLLVSLMYIILPKLSHGPFWYDMTNDAAKYCERNWWINLLHLQSFYRSDQMCNLVSWWISVDIFYYIIALVLISLILNQRVKMALIFTTVFVCYCTMQAAYLHYTGGFTPNNLGTVPQVGEVWSDFVVKYVWSPFPHAFPFFLGLWVGYMLALKKWQHFVVEYHRVGWLITVASMLLVNLSSHIWMSGAVQLAADPATAAHGTPQLVSTAYNIICTIIWALGFAWIIIACHYGCAPNLNKFLSIDIFVLLSKVSFIIYLSHMLVIRAFYGSLHALIEVSIAIELYILANFIFQSTIFGIILHVAFESPLMKFQRSLINRLKAGNGCKSYPMSLGATTTHKIAPSHYEFDAHEKTAD